MKRLIPVFLALVLLLSACSSKKSVLPATLDSDGTPQSESQQEVQLQAMPPAEKKAAPRRRGRPRKTPAPEAAAAAAT